MIHWVCFTDITLQESSSCVKRTWTHGQRDTHRHGGKTKEEHGKSIFSMLPLVSPGRQDWWRDGSISCSINAWGLKGCACTCAFSYTHHVTLQRSSTGRNRSVCRGSSTLPLSAAVSSYSLEEGSAGTRGSMFMMRFLWLRELKLRLWPNWTLKTQTSTIRYAVHYFCVCMTNLLQMLSHFRKL